MPQPLRLPRSFRTLSIALLGLALAAGCAGPQPQSSVSATAGPAAAPRAATVTTEFIRLTNDYAVNDAVLRAPSTGPRKVALLYTHPFAASSLTGFFCDALPARGFAVLCLNNRFSNNQQFNTNWEPIALDVASGVQELRARGYEKVFLIGFSAGGPTVAYYQALAERGNAVFKGASALSGFKGFFDKTGGERRLPPADGIVMVNPSSGIGASVMFRLDGSVVNEETGSRDPSLDMYAAANGFDAARGVASYSPEFLRRYRAAQCDRMNRLIEASTQRMAAVKAGRARFIDDELGATVGLRANPAYVDRSLAASTRGQYLILPDRVVTTIVNDRTVANLAQRNRGIDEAARTDASFLSYRAVRCNRFDPDAVTAGEHGLDTTSSNNVTYDNMASVSVPTLILQGTADNTIVHLTVAELIFNSTRAGDKSLWYVKGMTHGITALSPSHGDVSAITADAISGWIDTRVRRVD